MSPKCVPCLRSLAVAGTTFLLAAAFSGCAHNYHVKVDALCNPDVAAGTTYRLIPHDEVGADSNPNFDEAVRLVEAALAARGLHPARSPAEAELVIELDFGHGSRRRSVVDNVDLLGTPLVPPTPPLQDGTPAEAVAYMQGAQVLAAPPPTRTTVITFHEKYLTLSARETERATLGLRKPVELWRVKVTVEEPDATIDACLPVLVLAAANTIGTSTETRTLVRVAEEAPEVLLARAQ